MVAVITPWSMVAVITPRSMVGVITPSINKTWTQFVMT
jgi:hypothetical protein